MTTPLVMITATPSGQQYATGLRDVGFQVHCATSFPDGVRAVVETKPTVVLTLVDDANASEQCAVLRALGDMALIVGGRELSATATAGCLDAGADAVMQMPIPVAELRARLEAVLRRCDVPALAVDGGALAIGDLTVDLQTRSVTRGGHEVKLSPTEFKLLAVLAESPGRVVTNRELLTAVWGPEYADDLHFVRLYIGYLRTKLEADPHRPKLIVNQWGVGYRLVVDSHAAV